MAAQPPPTPAIYRVWCATEGRNVFTDGYVDAAPSACPNDPAHEIDPDSVVLVDTQPVEDTIFSAAEGAKAAASTETQLAVQGADARMIEARDALQAELDALTVRVETPKLRYVPLQTGADVVKSSAERVAAFLWHPGDAVGVQHAVYIRGMAVRRAGGQAHARVFDYDMNATIGGEQSFPIEDAPATMVVDISPASRPDGSPPYPIEVYVRADNPLSIECVAVTGP